MSTASAVTNYTFDEIAIGDSASLTRLINCDDITEFASVFGEFSLVYPGLTETMTIRSMLGGALIAAVLGTRLPGHGTEYVTQSFRFFRPIADGDCLTTTVTVREKHPKTYSIVLDCACVDDTDSMVMTGVAEVVAPTKRHPT